MSRILLLNPDDPPLRVARLSETIELPVHGSSRDVFLTHSVYSHIIERRILTGDRQVALVLQRISAVLETPTHCGRRTDDARKMEFYLRIIGDPAGVCVCIKCVDGETWVSTAFPVGTRTIVKYCRQKRLVPIA